MTRDLSRIQKGKIQGPSKIVVYGPPGVGKSTFASEAPNPIFIGTENGTEQLDIARVPSDELNGWGDVMQWLETFATTAHGYETLVVDSVDWLEVWLFTYVANNSQKANIEDFGYAAGYKRCVQEWHSFCERLDRCRDNGMHVVLVCHSKISRFSDPAGEEWDRYSLAIHDKKSADAAAVIKQWADELYFVIYDQEARKKNKWDSKGKGSNERWIYTQHSPAYDAKSRRGVARRVPLNGKAYWENVGPPPNPRVGQAVPASQNRPPSGVNPDRKVEQQPKAPAEEAHGEHKDCEPEPKAPSLADGSRERIAKQAEGLPDKGRKIALGFLKKAGDDMTKLAKLGAWVEKELAKAEAAASPAQQDEAAQGRRSLAPAQKG